MIYNVENLREDVTIHLGNQGENDAVVLQFDISQWAEKWPGGQASITYRRPNDPAVYPVLPGKVIVDDNVLSWTIDNDVTAVDGRGQAIIMYKQDDIVSHTVRMSTLVRPGLPTAGSPPNPVANWLQEAQGIMGQIANLRFEINADGELEASTSEGSLGRVRIVPRGQYYPNVEYKFLDMVFDGGNSYLYKDVPKSTGTPVTDTTHWQQIAAKGDTGPSAYDAAVAGEYAGTEAEFNAANAGIEAAKDAALGAAETANEAAENAETAAYRSMLWRKTASGNPVSVYPVPESPLYPKVSGTFTQAGTGDPSPENIRPITPWLASGATAKVTRTGKNLLDLGGNSAHWEYIGDNTFQSTVAYHPLRSYYYLRYLPQIPGVGIVFKFKIKGETGKNPRFKIVYTDATEWLAYPISDGVNFVEVTMVSNTAKTVDYIQFDYSNLDSAACYVKDAQIEYGSTATSYEPYSGQEITLTAPQEIAAGWMDTEGRGQLTWAKRVFDGTENWTFRVSGTVTSEFSLNSSIPNGALYDATISSFVTSHVPSLAAGDVERHSVTVSGGISWFRLNKQRMSGWDDAWSNSQKVAAFKAFLAAQYAAGTPVTFVYRLATPTPITPAIAPLTALPQLDRITPRQNVLTAPTGNIELTYAKSPIRESDEIATAIAAL